MRFIRIDNICSSLTFFLLHHLVKIRDKHDNIICYITLSLCKNINFIALIFGYLHLWTFTPFYISNANFKIKIDLNIYVLTI